MQVGVFGICVWCVWETSPFVSLWVCRGLTARPADKNQPPLPLQTSSLPLHQCAYPLKCKGTRKQACLPVWKSVDTTLQTSEKMYNSSNTVYRPDNVLISIIFICHTVDMPRKQFGVNYFAERPYDNSTVTMKKYKTWYYYHS